MQDILSFVQLSFLIATILFTIKIRKMAKSDDKITDNLTKKEKVFIWVACFVDPVISGTIFYYSWKKIFPQKAKQANKISWLAFLLSILAYTSLLFIVLKV